MVFCWSEDPLATAVQERSLLLYVLVLTSSTSSSSVSSFLFSLRDPFSSVPFKVVVYITFPFTACPVQFPLLFWIVSERISFYCTLTRTYSLFTLSAYFISPFSPHPNLKMLHPIRITSLPVPIITPYSKPFTNLCLISEFILPKKKIILLNQGLFVFISSGWLAK